MIFSRFFSPSHASKNPQTRIDAIADLSPDKASEKAILHELAFNDDNADVSLTALRKLHSFALWQKMAQIASNSKIKKTAQQHVEQAVLGRNSLTPDASQRRAYLLESAPPDLIVKALFEDDWLLVQEDLVVTLFSRLAKPTVLKSFFLRRATPSLQQKLVATVDDTGLLARLQKKSSSSATQQLIEQRLNTLKERQQKPIEIEKRTTLVLSKLLALLEKSDYGEINARFGDLQREYGNLVSEFVCLAADIRETLEAKHSRIVEQVERHLQRQKPQWELQQKRAEAVTLVDNANRALGAAQADIERLFAQPISGASQQEIDSVRSALADVAQHIENVRPRAEASQLASLQRQYQQLTVSIEDIELQQAAAARLEALLAESESINFANEEEADRFSALAEEWQQLQKKVYKLPPDWLARWRKREAMAKSSRQQLKAEQEQHLKQCRRHINAINGLIENGKFRPAMSRFEKLQESYQALSENAKEVLANRYQQVQEQIERLEGWQAYIATPRKPALLEDAKNLAATTPEDIHQRAASIKYLRQQWNSLGSSANDDELKAEFDTFLEQAFAPCREFYAHQETLREQAVAHREELINQAATLEEIESPAELIKQLEKLKKQWREAPMVDKNRYQQLKQRWEQTIEPFNEHITSWQQENKNAKQALIDKAQTLLELDDAKEASEQALQLQQQWKTIGPAGRRQESKLWQSFREINDAIFAKRKQIRQELNQQSAKVADELFARLSKVERETSEQPIIDSERALDALESDVQNAELSRGLEAKLNVQIGELRRQLKDQHVQNRIERRREQLEALIEVLCAWRPDNQDPQLNVSSSLWERLDKKEQLALMSPKPPSRDREWLTVTLELVLNLDTPVDDVLKQNVQLELMAAKLERGEDTNVDAIIAQWAAWGPVSEKQQSLFTRFTTCVYRYLDTLKEEAQ